MFRFFSRKHEPAAKVPNLPSDPMAVDSEPQQLRTPSPSEAAFNGLGAHPNITMTPSAPGPSIPDTSKSAVPPTPEALHALVTSVPPKILHTYVLDNIPAAPPDTLATLASFFVTLSPPPLLHCVRCHDDYTDVENGDRSCRVPHDDDSAEVELVGRARGECEYETFYGCCSKTVEGEGDLGPPDGWCYEGMHTTDARRARFRADATHADDKLVSCLRLNCHNIRARIPTTSAGASASTSGRAKRARPPPVEAEGDDDDGGSEGTGDTGIAEIARGVGSLGPKSKGKGKARANAKPKAEMLAAGISTSTPTPTPKRGRGRPRVRVQAPRSVQESDGESDKADNVKAPAVAAVTPASRRGRRRSDAKPRSAATPSPGKATTSPPSSPNTRGRKPPSMSKMDSVEIKMTRSRSRTRSRVRGSGAETGDERTEGRLRKRRRVAHSSTA